MSKTNLTGTASSTIQEPLPKRTLCQTDFDYNKLCGQMERREIPVCYFTQCLSLLFDEHHFTVKFGPACTFHIPKYLRKRKLSSLLIPNKTVYTDTIFTKSPSSKIYSRGFYYSATGQLDLPVIAYIEFDNKCLERILNLKTPRLNNEFLVNSKQVRYTNGFLKANLDPHVLINGQTATRLILRDTFDSDYRRLMKGDKVRSRKLMEYMNDVCLNCHSSSRYMRFFLNSTFGFDLSLSQLRGADPYYYDALERQGGSLISLMGRVELKERSRIYAECVYVLNTLLRSYNPINCYNMTMLRYLARYKCRHWYSLGVITLDQVRGQCFQHMIRDLTLGEKRMKTVFHCQACKSDTMRHKKQVLFLFIEANQVFMDVMTQ